MIEGENHLANPDARLDALGIAHEERGADALLVGKAPLGAQAVLAEEEAVVPQEHDASPVELPLFFQRLQDRADALVDRSHHRRALARLFLGADVQRLEERACRRVGAEREDFLPSRFLLQHLVERQHARAHRVGLTLVEIAVPRRQHVTLHRGNVDRPVLLLLHVRMHRLVREEKRERLVALSPDVLDGALRKDVGDIALDPMLGAVFPQHRVHDLSLAAERQPVVVAGPRARVVAHVPLADVCGFVAEPFQLEVVVREAVAHCVAPDVVDDAVAARVLAREDRSAVGRAQRRGVERVQELRALVREAVDVGRLHVRMPGRARLVEAQVVDEDDKEVRFHRALIAVGCRARARACPSARYRRVSRRRTRPACCPPAGAPPAPGAL